MQTNVQETKRLRHYTNKQKILLVGEGDFSFSLSLARAFGSASNLTATSLDTQGELEQKFKNGKANVEELERLGCSVVYGVNVHSMITKPSVGGSAIYDRVIFNFPTHELVRGFMKSARVLVKDEDKGGEIHVIHKTEYPFSEWKLKTLGEKEGLDLIREVEFCLSHYPGYFNKRGSGGYSDSSFPVGKSSTFMFTKQFFY
ncbi:hypothetical protein ISN45_At05g051860 [Arabidopsis thaliana x Arabidopsis arenosa]|uniref:25S rRNA (uridine-N(3))-methyltransferase BMT5-like domain-containing protein n=3 Tax=Arabidopsis TaxID=3701 RepID=A0A178UDE8_ARATH|nr:hypothetical protein ISN45_At05g051860 [Arabidopsis thaliana x Arabidopsis arenosa]OAO91274.1 hypothetical protein AXX17_AT5G55240 [Arabidopsis thaliana]